MNKTDILAVGRNKETLKALTELIRGNAEWTLMVSSTDEDAIEQFHRYHFDVVLLTEGMGDAEDRKLRKIFAHQNHDIIIIQYSVGDDAVLRKEILEALDKRNRENKPGVSFVDDALKDAGLNIIVQ